MRTIFLLCLMLIPGSPTHAEALCGQAEDAHCLVADGSYRIALPAEGAATKALVWLHGWGGSADAVMRNKGMRARLSARGYALIAPDGRVTSTRTANKNWAVHDGRAYERNDISFLRSVIGDAVGRYGLDPSTVLLGGFSRGGSMVWDVACLAPETARAYAPVAGAFWDPMPPACEGGTDLFHTHGWMDRTVPLEGRPLRNGVMTQGDVFQSLFILRAANGCTNRQPDQAELQDEGPFWLRSWQDCTAGRIDFLLHKGGHSIPKGWLNRTLDWFEARLAE